MGQQDVLDKLIAFLASLAHDAASTLGDADTRALLMLEAGVIPSAAGGTVDTSPLLQQLEAVRVNAETGGADAGSDALQRLDDLSQALMALVSLVELAADVHDAESALQATGALLDAIAVGRLRVRHPTWLALLNALHLISEDRLLIADAIRERDRWGSFLLGNPRSEDEEVENWSLILAAGLALLGSFIPPEDDTGSARRIDSLFGWDPDPSPAQPNAARLLGRMATLRWTERQPDGQAGPDLELGATLAVVPPADGGWGIFFALELGAGLTFPIGEHLELLLSYDAPAAFAAVLGHESKLLPGGSGTSAKIELRRKQEGAEHWVIGPEQKVHLEIGTFSTGFQLGPEAGFRLKIGDGALKLPKEALGPIGSVLPSDGATLTFDVDLLIDGNGRVAFVGGAGLTVTVPVNRKLAILDVHSITVAAQLKDGDKGAAAALKVTSAFSLVFGTVLTFVVDGIGAELAWTLPASPRPAPGAPPPPPPGGALGPYGDLALDFVMPKGIGVAFAAGPIKGGGFLSFDREHKTYGGVLEASLGLCKKGISLKAAGVLRETPDGWSLVVIVSAEFAPPFPLFLGMSLSGVGGLVGINVALDVDKLREGIHDGAVGRLLFPKDPIANAPAIIETLSNVFPPRPGGWVAGPMLQLSFGQPPQELARVSFALVVAMPKPALIAILGRFSLFAPDEHLEIISIKVDFLGVIDLEEPSVSVDASLVDSKIANFTLSGDMAMRANPQGFLLSFGGFNPHFNPPLPVPKLKRLALDISANAFTKIRCEAYLAVTSNTFQIGLHAELDVKAGPASLHGWAGLDALLQWDPKFWFSVEFSAGLELRVSGHCLAGISVDLLLEGPGPWHARGSATVHILFLSVTAHFETTWGEDGHGQPIPTVDATGIVAQALEAPEAWSAVAPDGDPLVAFRTLEEAETAAHPDGWISVRQQRVPLGIPITRIGVAHVLGDTATVNISPVEGAISSRPTNGLFAVGQFQVLSDDEALSRPSFESFQDGIEFGSTEVTLSKEQAVTANYETIFIPDDRPRGRGPVETALLLGALDHSAVARSGRHQAEIYDGPDQRVKLADTAYHVVAADTLTTVAGAGEAFGSATAALAAAATHPESVLVVEAQEVVS